MMIPLTIKHDRQVPFDVAVVMPTMLRPSLERAIRSIFAQDLSGRIQILLGIDVARGEYDQVRRLVEICPDHIALDLIDPGYSTSARHGGVHPNQASGSLRAVLTYLANSRFVAYLDDDNWWAANHLSSLRAAIDGHGWSWSLRWFVEQGYDEPLCIDEWESVGVGAGVFKERFGGFVDPSSLMIDKLACEAAIPAWSMTPFRDGRGSDRLVFAELAKNFRVRGTGRASSFYTISPDDILHIPRRRWFRQKGVKLRAEADQPCLENFMKKCPQGGKTPRHRKNVPVDPILTTLLAHLMPSDALVFERDSGNLARQLAEAVKCLDLTCPILTIDQEESTAHKQSQLACLEAHHIQTDLIELAADWGEIPALQRIWPLLRRGGFMIGHGTPSRAIEQFATDHNSDFMELAFHHSGPAWVIEKGVISF